MEAEDVDQSSPERLLHHVVAPPSLRTWFEHFVSADVDHIHMAPEDDTDAAALTERLLRTGGDRFILHSSHRSLHRDAEVARQLRDYGLRAVAQGTDSVMLALDKGQMKEFFTRIGARTPPMPAEASAAVRDWVVKRRHGTEGHGMRFAVGPAPAHSADEYVEAFVAGLEFSVIAYVEGDRFVTLPVVEKGWATPALRPPYRRARVCPPAPHHEAVAADMLATTRLIAVEAGILGWLEVEFVVDSFGQHWVLEINPRICGTMRLAAMCADVAIFDIPGRTDLEGHLPAVRRGAEVPWHGEPIVDPALQTFATSRLTVSAGDAATLRARLRAQGVNLEANGLEAHGLGAVGSYRLVSRPTLTSVLERLARRDGTDPRDHDLIFGADSDVVTGTASFKAAVESAVSLWKRGSRARVYALVPETVHDADQLRETASFAAGSDLANLTVVVDRAPPEDLPGARTAAATPTGRVDSVDLWRDAGWDACAVDGQDLDALQAALRGLPSTRPHAVVLTGLR